jgi:plasmid maintenance system antidote protein VapI
MSRVGERHHYAKLTDKEVEEMRRMYEEGGIGYDRLAKVFDVHKATVQGIVTYKRRISG